MHFDILQFNVLDLIYRLAKPEIIVIINLGFRKQIMIKASQNVPLEMIPDRTIKCI